MIRNGRFNKSFLASCDAVALYPSIIIEEALEILEQMIWDDQTLEDKTDIEKSEIIELVRLCAEDPYFECDLGFFKQQGGTHMGGALSRLFADLIIENRFERKIRENPDWGEKWDWIRLVDDTLSAWDSEEEFKEFFKYLNTIHPGIAWTCEIEQEGKLPIFDILIIRKETGFDTTVYRKPSASNRYIHYTSAQAPKEKLGAIRTLRNRALEYCSTQELLDKELEKLKETFLQNGYPEVLINRILYEEKREKGKETQPKEFEFSKVFHVPYHPRGKRLASILEKKFGIETSYKKTQTLADILKRKGRTVEQKYKKNVVYKIPCSQCEVSYIGQTKKSINVRMGQHDRKCKEKTNLRRLKSEKQENGLAVHHAETGHEFDYQGVKILAEEPYLWRRLIKEGIEIRKGTSLANLKRGYEISEIWDPFLDIPA